MKKAAEIRVVFSLSCCFFLLFNLMSALLSEVSLFSKTSRENILGIFISRDRLSWLSAQLVCEPSLPAADAAFPGELASLPSDRLPS